MKISIKCLTSRHKLFDYRFLFILIWESQQQAPAGICVHASSEVRGIADKIKDNFGRVTELLLLDYLPDCAAAIGEGSLCLLHLLSTTLRMAIK